MFKTKEFFAVYSLGAAGYSLLELLWRDFTHWTMALAGGTCFWLIYRAGDRFSAYPLWKRCCIGCGIITGVEFLVGCVVNLLLGLRVWDYSRQPFHLLGQVCPLYSALWFLLCAPLFPLARLLRRAFGGR
ncbi:MAG: hypothetical protein PHD67_03290 [Oscillospiraceae bacterium]|nr:hypothetical protein [Oscillospiraceae bacterium]